MAKLRSALIDAYFNNIREVRKLNFAPHAGQAKLMQGLTHAQLAIMMLIQHHGLNTLKDLANYMGVSPSATTQLMNGLVEQKLITRATDKIDRRKTILTLSKKGIAVSKAVKQQMRNRFAILLEPLTDKELKQLVALQQKILTYAKSQKGK